MSESGGIPSHLYVHVPLCRSKCSYCDFYSVPVAEAPVDSIEAGSRLAAQAIAWLDRGLVSRGLETLYVGGGTPSVLGPELPILIAEIASAFGLASGAEVTVEANPDSLDAALAALLARAGATRVSLGVQSFDDAELALLGRCHDAESALRASSAVVAAGLDLSLDLMCGLPGQSEATWAATIRTAIKTGAGHISVYPLAVEAATPLAGAIIVGDVAEPDPDVAAEMMLIAADRLAEAGFERYEVANYARPGSESRHNTAYWTGREYLGVGPGAHGMLSAATAEAAGIVAARSPGAARVRYAVACDLREGLAVAPPVEIEVLDEVEAVREDAMLGLRLARGIDDALANRAGVWRALDRLRGQGLVLHEGGRWRTSERGWLLGNEVFGAIWGADAT